MATFGNKTAQTNKIATPQFVPPIPGTENIFSSVSEKSKTICPT